MIEFSAHVSGDMLYFYANTHRFDTGAATDADSAPTYRVYIQENSTPVTTGTMALLDSANTAGFYSEAVSLAAYDPSEYVCYISATVNSVTGTKSFPFTVGQGAGATVVRTTIATLASQTSFTLTGGPADNNALNRMMIVVRDAVNVDQFCVGLISAYTGVSKTVTLAADPAVFTMAVGDFVEVIAIPRQLPNAEAEAAGGLYTRGAGAGQINQQANGQIDTNLMRVDNAALTAHAAGKVPADLLTVAGTAQTAGDIIGDTNDIQARLPTALTVAGNLKADVEEWRASVPNTLNSGTVQADVERWINAVPAALSANGYVQAMLLRWLTDNAAGTPGALSNGNVKADLKEIDEGATNGYNATLRLKQLDIVNNAGDAIKARSTGGDGNGMTLDGLGYGLQASGSVNGMYIYSAVGPGHGIVALGSAGHGLHLVGDGVGGKSINAPQDIAASDGNLTLANINAQVVDGLNVDMYAEPGQEIPPATTTLVKKIGYLYKFLRNRITQTSTTLSIYADNGTTVDQKATVSDDTTTYDRGEIGIGP